MTKLAPPFHRTIKFEGGIFAPGIGASAVVIDNESPAESTPIRMTELHWAYYALHIGIDRNLLAVLNQQRWNRGYPLKQLEADAESVFADYRRIADARARLESHLAGLGGDDLAVWDAIAKVQRFDAVFDAVDRKLKVLEKLAERRVVLAADERDRRVGNVLGALSALTLVSVTGGLIGLVLGAGNPSWDPWWLSLAFVAVAVVTAIMLYLHTFTRVVRYPMSNARRGSPS